MRRITSLFAGLGAALLLSACSVSQNTAPSLTGPSEFALSVDVTASPDTLTQDGQAQSTIGVVARGPDGQPRANVTFRLDIQVEGEPADFGALSVRRITTASDGRATAVYRAPSAPPPSVGAAGSCDASWSELGGRCVRVVATPEGSGFDTANSQSVLIHLVPTSVIVPVSATPDAKFTAMPTTPAANSPVQFDASSSCAGRPVEGQCPSNAGQITSYRWDFGDGGTATGRTMSHTFRGQQTYLVTLTVTNDRGITSAPFTQSLNVGAGALPTAAFSVSPTSPVPGQPVHFDASTSKPGPGHTLVRYVWNFGDGTALLDTNATTATHTYQVAGSYVVTLRAADDAEQVGVTTQTVTVGSAAP